MDVAGIRKNTDLASRVGCSEGNIRYLLGLVDPPKKLEVPAKIATALKVRVAWLLYGVGDMYSPAADGEDPEAVYLQQHSGAVGRDVLADSAPSLDPDLLARALTAALKHRPNQAPEVLARAAVGAYDTAKRLVKPGKIEDLVRALLD